MNGRRYRLVRSSFPSLAVVAVPPEPARGDTGRWWRSFAAHLWTFSSEPVVRWWDEPCCV